jgi:cellulose biosynthesis protein BcsQ
MSGKVVTVWGAPGSGKSVIAAKLAAELAGRGRSVILLLCGTLAPMLPCVCAPDKIERERSLGSVFAAVRCSANLIRNNFTTLRSADKLSLLGLLKGESSRSFPPCSARLAVELIGSLREVSEFAVVDAASELDVLTLSALQGADTTLRLVSAELKSASYFASQLPRLKELGIGADAHLRVANAPRPPSAWERIGGAFSRTDFALPYCAELERQAAEGALLVPLKSRGSKAFTRELDKIVKKLEVL